MKCATALMKEHGTWLVPTLTVFELFYEVASKHPELLSPGTPAKELQYDQLPKKNFALAVKSGVRVAFGTDIGEGDHTQEFALMIGAGMPRAMRCSPRSAMPRPSRAETQALARSAAGYHGN